MTYTARLGAALWTLALKAVLIICYAWSYLEPVAPARKVKK
jgi:hypothetical protein